MGVGRNNNNFASGATDRETLNTELPTDIDTSLPLIVTVRYRPNDNSSGDIRFVVRWGYTVNLADDPSPVGTTISSVFSSTGSAPTTAAGRLGSITTLAPVAAGSSNRMISTAFSLSICTLRARRTTGSLEGDLLWISIERTGGDVTDTYGGNIHMVQLSLKYTKWCHGEPTQ